MTVEQMKETYDKVDKAIEAKNFLAECWEDTQLTFDRSGFRGELDEQLSVFSWFCCKRLCEKGIKAIIICIVEAIAVASIITVLLVSAFTSVGYAVVRTIGDLFRQKINIKKMLDYQ